MFSLEVLESLRNLMSWEKKLFDNVEILYEFVQCELYIFIILRKNEWSSKSKSRLYKKMYKNVIKKGHVWEILLAVLWGFFSLALHIYCLVPTVHVTQTAVLNLSLAFLHSCKWTLFPLSSSCVGLRIQIHVTEERTASIPTLNRLCCFLATRRVTAEVHTMPRCVRQAVSKRAASRQPPV